MVVDFHLLAAVPQVWSATAVGDDIVVVDHAPNCLDNFKSLLATAARKRGEMDYGQILERVPNMCRRLDTLLCT